jgi:hypothetical protein
MDTVRRLGLLGGENGRIDGRICRPPAAAAKKKSGIASDAELAEYALAKVAIEDDFGTKLLCRKGRIAQDAEVLLSRALCGGSNRNVPRTQSGAAHSRFAPVWRHRRGWRGAAPRHLLCRRPAGPYTGERGSTAARIVNRSTVCLAGNDSSLRSPPPGA